MCLYIVPGDETFTTQSAPIRIFHRMTRNAFLQVVAEFETTVTQSTMLCHLPGMAFHVYCLEISDAPLEYFIHQELSLPTKCLQQGQKLLSIDGLPLPILSTRNHLNLLHCFFKIARILFGNTGPLLTVDPPVIIP